MHCFLGLHHPICRIEKGDLAVPQRTKGLASFGHGNAEVQPGKLHGLRRRGLLAPRRSPHRRGTADAPGCIPRENTTEKILSVLHSQRAGSARSIALVGCARSLTSSVMGEHAWGAQVDYTEDPGTMYFFRYPVADAEGEEHLPVATTRPETILGDTAVAVHPEAGALPPS